MFYNDDIKIIKEFYYDFETKKHKLSTHIITKIFSKKNSLNLQNDYIIYLKKQIDELNKKYSEKKYNKKALLNLYILEKYTDYRPICKNKDCKNLVNFDNWLKDFKDFCSVSCRNKDIQSRKKISNAWKTKDKNELKEIIKKREKNCLDKYGVTNPMQSLEIQEKTKRTNLEKYGVEYSIQSNVIKEKIKKTNLEKYGTVSTSQKHIKNYHLYNDKEFIEKEFIKNGFFLIDYFESFFNVKEKAAYSKLKELGIEYVHKKSSSSYEEELIIFLKEIDPDVKILRNNTEIISPYEIDIFLPDYDFGIEFHGIYWHSINKRNYNDKKLIKKLKTNHQKKALESIKKDILLFQIFENEWIYKKELWKSMIKAAMNKIKNRIYARKCKIKEISFKEVKEFLEENHMQSYSTSKFNFALEYNNEIVSVMTFSKSRFSKKHDFELHRFCNKKDYIVVGAAGKLLNHFIKNNMTTGQILSSYANLRWSNGNLYRKLGFDQKTISKPNYFYFKNKDSKMIPRVTFQKHKLLKMIEKKEMKIPENISPSSMTETEIAIYNNYNIIYDAGNMLFEMRIN